MPASSVGTSGVITRQGCCRGPAGADGAAHVNETTAPVDHVGGILSVLLVGGLVLGINFAAVPGAGTLVLGMAAIALAALIAFVMRQRCASNPLYDLHVAARPTFWVAACAGLVVFGSLMGAMFHRAAVPAERARLRQPAGRRRDPPRSLLHGPCGAPFGEARRVIGASAVLLTGYAFVLLGFRTMLLLWKEDSSYRVVGLAHALVGVGVGFRRDPRIALADRLRPGDAGRHGLRNR